MLVYIQQESGEISRLAHVRAAALHKGCFSYAQKGVEDGIN